MLRGSGPLPNRRLGLPTQTPTGANTDGGAIGGGGGGGGVAYGTNLWAWFDTWFGGNWSHGSLPTSVGRTVDVTSMSALQTACNNAINGDTIRLKAPSGTAATFGGTLDWENHTYSTANPVTITMFPGHTVTLNNVPGGSGTHDIFIKGLTGVRFLNLVIGGARNCGIKQDSCNDIEYNGCSVTATGQVVEGEGILVVGQNNRISLMNNKTFACGEHGVYLGSFAGATSYGISGLLVANHLSYDNFNGAGTSSGGYGLQLGDSLVHARVVNFTTDGNGAGSSAGGANLFSQGSVTGNHGQDVAFINGILSNNNHYGINGSGSTPNQATNFLTYCLGWNNPDGNFSGGTMFNVVSPNITGSDPSFVNRTAKNFKLNSGSPARAAGDASWMPSTDIDGTTRTTADMGCYAF